MVSVITPVLDVRFLERTWRSLLVQDCDWEWLVQVDAESIPELSGEILADGRVKVEASGRHCGTPACRNLALARSSGDVVQMLDGDDELLPDALVQLQDACLQDGIGFATADLINKFEDGKREHCSNLPFGKIEIDGIHLYEVENLRFPVQAAATCYRRSVLVEAGGFSAWTHGDDVITLKRVNHKHCGWHITEPLIVYHHYDGQVTSQESVLPLRTLRRDFESEMVDYWNIKPLPNLPYKKSH